MRYSLLLQHLLRHFSPLHKYNPINNIPVDTNTRLTVKVCGCKLSCWDIYVASITIPIVDINVPTINKVCIVK